MAAVATGIAVGAAAAAEQVATGRQIERLGARAGYCRLRHEGSALPMTPEPSLLRFRKRKCGRS
jgi:hypothetical protein